MWLGGGP
ncbi:hypothetical protein YPPY10_4676, partial [Yersinia pestis PY-10]